MPYLISWVAMAEEDEVINISQQEDKGLRRVYYRLCDFSQKEK